MDLAVWVGGWMVAIHPTTFFFFWVYPLPMGLLYICSRLTDNNHVAPTALEIIYMYIAGQFHMS